jgi:hypothetical protein
MDHAICFGLTAHLDAVMLKIGTMRCNGMLKTGLARNITYGVNLRGSCSADNASSSPSIVNLTSSTNTAKKDTIVCTTNKVKLILPATGLSTSGSRRRSGLIAINGINICLEMTGYRENIEK